MSLLWGPHHCWLRANKAHACAAPCSCAEWVSLPPRAAQFVAPVVRGTLSSVHFWWREAFVGTWRTDVGIDLEITIRNHALYLMPKFIIIPFHRKLTLYSDTYIFSYTYMAHYILTSISTSTFISTGRPCIYVMSINLFKKRTIVYISFYYGTRKYFRPSGRIF